MSSSLSSKVVDISTATPSASNTALPSESTMGQFVCSRQKKVKRSLRLFVDVSVIMPPFGIGLKAHKTLKEAQESYNIGCDLDAYKLEKKSINWAAASYLCGLVLYWAVIGVLVVLVYSGTGGTDGGTDAFDVSTLEDKVEASIVSIVVNSTHDQEQNRKKCLIGGRNVERLQMWLDNRESNESLGNMVSLSSGGLRDYMCTIRQVGQRTIVGVPLCDTLWRMESWRNESEELCGKLNVNLPEYLPFSGNLPLLESVCPPRRIVKTCKMEGCICETQFYFPVDDKDTE